MGRVVGLVVALACAALVLALLWRTPANPPGAEPQAVLGHAATAPAPELAAAAPSLQGSRRTPTAPQPPDASAGPALTTYMGNVSTATGLPAVDVTVEAVVGGAVLTSKQTDAAGSFTFVIADATSPHERVGSVRARAADGSVAQAPLFLVVQADAGASGAASGKPQIVGPLRLGPPHALDVRVLAPCRADAPATLWLLSTTLMFGAPWAIQQTDADGRASFTGLPAGSWMVVAAAPGCGRARVLVQLPREATAPVEISLGEARVVQVKVRDGADQTPIVGAVLSVAERVRLPEYSTTAPLYSTPATLATDAEGVARIEGLSGQEILLLTAEAEGYPRPSEMSRGRGGGGPGQAQTEPGQVEVLIELHKPLTVRWPLTNEGIGVPADGSEVSIEPWTNTGRLVVPPRGVIEGQELVVPGWGADGASGYAVLAGQGVARLQAGPRETRGHPTAFYPLRKIDLVAKHADGRPATGWFLVVRDGGNNPVKPGVKTDAEGRATMHGLYGGPGSLVDVSVSEMDGWGGFVLPLGSVNLRERDGRFEAEIPAERALRIRLTLQGAAVPEGFAGWPTLNQARIVVPAGSEARPKDGVFETTWRPHRADATAVVSAQALGYLAESKQVTASELAAGTEVVIDLQPAGSVVIQVKEPEDKRYGVAVDRWDPEAGVWGNPSMPAMFASGRGRRADANGVVELQGLQPGRYRAIDTVSGLTTEPFEVHPGGAPTRVAFDVSATGWARGRVVVPEGTALQGVSVGEADADPQASESVRLWGAALPGTPVNPKDGTFWVRVPGNRPVTLRIFHATLRPHPSLGQVTLTKPRDGLELHAVRGATARLRFTTPAPVFINRGQARPIAVRLYSGHVEGPGTPLAGMLDGAHQTVEFGGYAPGTYSVWIDAPGSVPVVLEGVVLGVDDADLGEVALSEGSSLEIGVSVKEGQSPPRVSVWAERLDEPTYTRSTDAAGATITLRGLGAGRFRVTATAYNGAAPPIHEEITFDGRSKVERKIDAR